MNDQQQPVGWQAAPRFLDTTVDLEKKFLQGRQNRAEELESAVRYFLEFLMGFESLEVANMDYNQWQGSGRQGSLSTSPGNEDLHRVQRGVWTKLGYTPAARP